MLALLLSPTVMPVEAQVNITEPLPGINGTIPLPPMGNTTLTNTTIPDSNMTSTDNNGIDTGGGPVDPVILALIKEQAQNRTQEMMQLLGNRTYSPDIMNGLMHAHQAMNQAMNFEENNSRAAAQQYLRAMKHFRNVLRKYINDKPDAFEVFD